MLRVLVLISCALLAACAGPAEMSPVPSTEATEPIAADEPAEPVTTTVSAASPDEPPAGPSYDVFLAAVAEAVEGTRYAQTPFDHPEVVVSTGLVLCEALDEGLSPDEVVLEYLSDLTSADPSAASEDQLVLTGALVGAAETALCGYGE